MMRLRDCVMVMRMSCRYQLLLLMTASEASATARELNIPVTSRIIWRVSMGVRLRGTTMELPGRSLGAS